MSRRAFPLVSLLAVVALVTGCAGAKTSASSIPESASLAPADALAYVTLTTDADASQWKQAERLLDRIPGARDALSGSVGNVLQGQGVDWHDDVAPALGPELVVVATAGKQPVVLVQPEDAAKLDGLLAKSTAKPVEATVDGWTALAQTQAALDAYRAALAKGSLDVVDAFGEGLGALPSDALARAWVDTARLSPELGQVVHQASSQIDLGLDWLAASVSAEDDGLLVTLAMKTPGSADTHYEPVLFQRVPVDAVAALSFGGTQGLLDRLQGTVDLDKVSTTVEKLTGLSLKGLTDSLSGEGALYVREVDGSTPEVTLVLRPPDPSKTWDAVVQLASKLAEQAKTTITVRTENGVEVRRIAADGATVSFARLADDTIIATTGADGIRTFAADGPKLVDSDAYRRAADAVDLGERTRGFLYVDVNGLLPLVEQATGQAASPDTRDALASVDAFVLQAAGTGDVTTVSGFLRLQD
jgi:Protein of unknown function (DUF3352)